MPSWVTPKVACPEASAPSAETVNDAWRLENVALATETFAEPCTPISCKLVLDKSTFGSSPVFSRSGFASWDDDEETVVAFSHELWVVVSSASRETKLYVVTLPSSNSSEVRLTEADV